MLQFRVSQEDSHAAPSNPVGPAVRNGRPPAPVMYTIPSTSSASVAGHRLPLQFPAPSTAGAADARARIAASIFRPSHILPTKSLEEFADEEIAAARARDERQKSASEREERRKAAMTEEEREDEEVDKARKWDDFKDENPTGWGNSKLRPCA